MTASGPAPGPERRCGRPCSSRVHVLSLLALALFTPGIICFAPEADSATHAESDAAVAEESGRPSYRAPFVNGLAGADSWVDPGEILGDTLAAPVVWDGINRPEAHTSVVDPRPVRLIPPGSRPVPHIPEIPVRLSRTAAGAYAGYPSAVGALVTAPVDGPLGFRFGLGAFPGLGVVWSPGFEVRIGQERGAYTRDGYHFFANLLYGRTYIGHDRERTAVEAGIGYRWVVSDRQGLRWIAAAEVGGRWGSRSSGWPDYPGLRVYWLLADW